MLISLTLFPVRVINVVQKTQEELHMNKFQIQLGLTGISRKEAAQVIADYFGTKAQYKGTLSYKFVIPNEEGKEWTVQLNKDIVPEKKEEEIIMPAENDYKVDIVTSEMTIENLGQLDLISKIEGAGAFINQSCRMKVITTAEYTDLAIKNLNKIFESKRELIYKALGIEDGKVEVADNNATFDLFKATLDADKIEAYIKFALAVNER